MELQRDKVVVEALNYGLPPKNQQVKQHISIDFSPLVATDPAYPKGNSIMGVRIEFVLPFDEFVVSGVISQVNHLVNQLIRDKNELTEKEANTMVRPIFQTIERLVYEITEISLDKPGIKINFAASDSK